MVRENPARGREEGTQGAVAILRREKRSKVSYLKTQIQWILFYENVKNCDWTLRRDTPEILRMHFSWAKVLGARFWGTTTWGNLTTSRLYQQSSAEFGEKICKFKPNITPRFFLLWRRQREKIVCLLCIRELNAQCWARRSELGYNGYFEKVQNPICDLPRLGTVQINEWAQVFVDDFDLFATVQLLDKTPAFQ